MEEINRERERAKELLNASEELALKIAEGLAARNFKRAFKREDYR